MFNQVSRFVSMDWNRASGGAGYGPKDTRVGLRIIPNAGRAPDASVARTLIRTGQTTIIVEASPRITVRALESMVKRYRRHGTIVLLPDLFRQDVLHLTVLPSGSVNETECRADARDALRRVQASFRSHVRAAAAQGASIRSAMLYARKSPRHASLADSILALVK